MRNLLQTLAIATLSSCLTPVEGMGGTPVPDQFGKVLDAVTDKPIAGVRIVAIDAGDSSENAPPRLNEAVTDSLGKYTLSLWGQAWVLYTSADYESVRFVYPKDLVDPDCESCCGRIRDVKLRRWRE